ncbi:Protein of unknown function [Pyronema omphalodes CBS 100304]|uniref:Uncharacterized protein n=1 Tax=Pyronema omphalodes (strain CBS 100304) TaxID=1076935 RepID=U4LC24_PYROM|nr:Protein of unknown function [Pyronema omphalodes CBS 100304]
MFTGIRMRSKRPFLPAVIQIHDKIRRRWTSFAPLIDCSNESICDHQSIGSGFGSIAMEGQERYYF